MSPSEDWKCGKADPRDQAALEEAHESGWTNSFLEPLDRFYQKHTLRIMLGYDNGCDDMNLILCIWSSF